MVSDLLRGPTPEFGLKGQKKQEILGRTNRLLSFGRRWTTQKMRAITGDR
jgi:hypothetical protein